MYRSEFSLGLVPRIQVNQGLNAGLGLGIGSFASGEYGGAGWVAQLGGQYDVARQAPGMHFDVWLGGIAVVLPFGTGVSMNHYWTDAGSVKNFRGEIGIGAVKGALTYGLNGYWGEGAAAFRGPKHTFQLRIYLSAWPSRKGTVFAPVAPMPTLPERGSAVE